MYSVEQGTTITKLPWAFVEFLMWIWSGIKSVITWFSPIQENYPPDEPGQLMRRYMAHKSWFDQTSSLWVGQSFWTKMAVVTGLSLFSALIGVMISASMVLALSTGFFSLLVHTLFMSHERHRWEGAKFSVAETLSLRQDLEATKILLEQATTVVDIAANELNSYSHEMKEQATILEAESQSIRSHNATLTAIIEEVQVNTANLLAQEKDVLKDAEDVLGDLKRLEPVITQISDNSLGMVDAVAQFCGEVTHIQQNQKVFSDTVSAAIKQLNFFAIEQARSTETPASQIAFDESSDLLDAELDENDQFIDEMKRLMPGLVV